MTLIAFVLAGCGFGIYKYDRTKRFEFAEKNSFAMGTIVSQKVYAPYGAKHIPSGCIAVCSYTMTTEAVAAAIDVLTGKAEATGRMPVVLPE